LASIIAEGLNPERAAEERGISKATARNQLKAISRKQRPIVKANWWLFSLAFRAEPYYSPKN
jgi:hypothetical protein